MSTNASDLTPASEQIVSDFDPDDISFMQSALGETPANNDASAGGGEAQGQGAPTEAAQGAGAEEQPLKEAVEGGEKADAASEAAAGDEKPEVKEEKQEAAATKPEESEPIGVLRQQRNTFKTKLEALEQSVGALAPVIKSVGVEPLTRLSTFVTSDKQDREFASDFCSGLEETDPMRYDQVCQFVIDESIKLEPRPVLEEIVDQHGDKVAEMLFGRGATFEGVKQAWAGRNAKPVVPKTDDGGYGGLDELLEDETPEEEKRKAVAPASQVAKPAAEDDEKRELRERLQKLEERIEQGTQSDQLTKDTQIIETFLGQALEPVKAMIEDAGLAALPEDDDGEKGRKQEAQRRIYAAVIEKMKGDSRSAVIGEFVEQYHRMPPGHRLEQAKALAESLAETEIAYHADTLHRKRTARVEKIGTPSPRNIGGNNQGRIIPGHVPRAEEIRAGAGWEDDESLIAETRDLLEAR